MCVDQLLSSSDGRETCRRKFCTETAISQPNKIVLLHQINRYRAKEKLATKTSSESNEVNRGINHPKYSLITHSLHIYIINIVPKGTGLRKHVLSSAIKLQKSPQKSLDHTHGHRGSASSHVACCCAVTKAKRLSTPRPLAPPPHRRSIGHTAGRPKIAASVRRHDLSVVAVLPPPPTAVSFFRLVFLLQTKGIWRRKWR